MPTYLLHGFRWPRPLIRIHIILQNLDDAAAEWLMAPATTTTLIQNFHTLYPTAVSSLPSLRFIEQYDPTDLSSDSKSQPFAYVADIVHEVKLGLDVDEMRGQGIPNEQWGAMVELRDAIAPGEKVAWWVVVCGDVERWAPPTMSLLNGSAAGLPEQQNQAYGAMSPPPGREGWSGESGYYGSASSHHSVEVSSFLLSSFSLIYFFPFFLFRCLIMGFLLLDPFFFIFTHTCALQTSRPQSAKGSLRRLFSRGGKEIRKSKR